MEQMIDMDVKVETFIAQSLADPTREVRPKMWRVRVDGKHAGFIGWKPGSKLEMYLRFAPDEVKYIEKEVARQIAKLTETEVREVKATEPPNFNVPKLEDEDEFDDLD